VITVVGICLGIYLARVAGPRERWLRVAVLAQTADLVTYAVVWEHAQGELNPLGGLARSAFLAAFTPAMGSAADGAAVLASSALLMGLKLGLIGFLLRAAPYLGRYRHVVLVVAAAAGTLGCVSNVAAHPNAGASLAIVAVYALVAVRWSARFGAAVRAGAGLTVAGLLGIGSLATLSYLAYADTPYVCGAPVCSPALSGQLQVLASVFFVAALIALAMTVRYVVRVVPPRRDRAA
jgi:hypothetical protein